MSMSMSTKHAQVSVWPRDGDIYGHETIIWTDVAKYHEVTLHANIKLFYSFS